MVDICLFIFVKTYKMYNTKSGPQCKLWPWLIIMYQYWLINCKKCTTLIQDGNKNIVNSISGNVCVCVCVCVGAGSESYMEHSNSLCFLLNFTISLNCL